MNYFKDIFIPSRTRVIKHLYSEHPWMMRLRNILLGDTIRFGLRLDANGVVTEYTIEEAPDASLEVYEGINDLEFKVLGVPLNLVFHIYEGFLRGWVEDEEKLMKHPLPYFLLYAFKLLPKARLG